MPRDLPVALGTLLQISDAMAFRGGETLILDELNSLLWRNPAAFLVCAVGQHNDAEM